VKIAKSLLKGLFASSLMASSMGANSELENKGLEDNKGLEQLLNESKARQTKSNFEIEYPFFRESKINYRAVISKSFFLINYRAYGIATLSTDLSFNAKDSIIGLFKLEGEGNHALVGKLSFSQISEVSIFPDKINFSEEGIKFVTKKYSFSKNSSNASEAVNTGIENILLDELSVIQFIRYLNLEKLPFSQEEGSVYNGFGAGNSIEGNRYPIIIYRSNEITPVKTDMGRFDDFYHVKIVLGKEQEQRLTVYYSKNEFKLPIFLQKRMGSSIGKFYIKGVER